LPGRFGSGQVYKTLIQYNTVSKIMQEKSREFGKIFLKLNREGRKKSEKSEFQIL
jgi:hypothetical protein